MNEELERRIQHALDAGARPEDDAELAEALERDDDLRAAARELERVDAALQRWPTPERDDEAWEALAARIESRLDEELEPMEDPTAPPPADESAMPEEGSGTYERSDKAAAAAPSQAPVAAERSGERGGGMWAAGLAVAAIALLAVGAYTLMEAGSPDGEVALAPAEGAPAEHERAGPSGGAPASAASEDRAAEEPEAETGDDRSADPKQAAGAKAETGDDRSADPKHAAAQAEADPDDGAGKERLRRRARPARRAAASSSGTASGGGGSASTDLEDGLEGGGRSAGGSAGSGEGALPATPSDDAVAEAMRVLGGKVRACTAETDAAVVVRVTVRGATGRPKHVAVLGELAETEPGVCVERVVRHLQLPRFRNAKHTFTHRFAR